MNDFLLVVGYIVSVYMVCVGNANIPEAAGSLLQTFYNSTTAACTTCEHNMDRCKIEATMCMFCILVFYFTVNAIVSIFKYRAVVPISPQPLPEKRRTHSIRAE